MSIQMKPIANSSAVEAAGYDPATKTLRVTYKGGRSYQASGVPAETWDEIDKSIDDPTVSTGSLLNGIKKGYSFEAVTE